MTDQKKPTQSQVDAALYVLDVWSKDARPCSDRAIYDARLIMERAEFHNMKPSDKAKRQARLLRP